MKRIYMTNVFDTEVWKPVPGYEGLYEVSDLGRVRNVITGRVRRAGPHPKGYSLVQLYKNGERSSYTVHSLVIGAFLGPRPPGTDIDHINGIRTDNRLSNLRYLDCVLNRRRDQTGEANNQRKLTKSQVHEIRGRYSLGTVSQYELGREYGVRQTTISKIVRGDRWSHLTG